MSGNTLTPMILRTGDPITRLPEGAAERLRLLRQRLEDARALVRNLTDKRLDLFSQKQQHQTRIAFLKLPRAAGGHSLDDDSTQVSDERRQLDTVSAELKRIDELLEVRAARADRISAVLRSAEEWIRNEIPGGCMIEDHTVEPQLKKNEILSEAIERYRRRVRELAADLHRVRSSPYPSHVAKQRMRDQIGALADQGRPDASLLVEHGTEITFPATMLRSTIYGEKMLAFGELTDAFAITVWLHHDQLVAKLDKEIDEISDDAEALTDEARAEAEATIRSDALAAEYDEAELVWKAQHEDAPIEHRPDIDPRALLAVELITLASTHASDVLVVDAVAS